VFIDVIITCLTPISGAEAAVSETRAVDALIPALDVLNRKRVEFTLKGKMLFIG
jgi:hypothetical protein